MAIETSGSKTPPAEFKFDENAWQNKVVKLTQLQSDFAGKKNYNPFVWFSETVQPLINQYRKGDRSKALFDSLMSIKEVVPVLDPDWQEEKPVVLPPAPRRMS